MGYAGIDARQAMLVMKLAPALLGLDRLPHAGNTGDRLIARPIQPVACGSYAVRRAD
jgi:hypothetical protein